MSSPESGLRCLAGGVVRSNPFNRTTLVALPAGRGWVGGLRVSGVGVRLTYDTPGALGHAERVRIIQDDVDRAHLYSAAAGAVTRRSASTIAGLLVEGHRSDARQQNGRVGRRTVAHRHSSNREAEQARAVRVG